MFNRRHFLAAGTIAGAAMILPYATLAQSASGDTFPTDSGEVTIWPVDHASFVMETPEGVIYVDPVGGAEAYSDYPEPELILLTHHHGDHFDLPTLQGLPGDAPLITNSTVYEELPDDMTSRATQMANGDTGEALGYSIEAIPAYNTTEDRQQYHPEGRDNGYVLDIDGLRVYISGDTEGTAEMRALEDINLAFVSMNLPYTMDVEQAAEAVAAFAPTYVYPYHYRDQDPEEFARLLGETDAETEVRMGTWYK